MRKRKLVTWDETIMKSCAQADWDWIATVTIPSPAEYENLAQNLERLRREIEQADGTLQFRSLFLIPKSFAAPTDTACVAVGGLSSANWSHWQRRWKEIEGHARSRLFPRWRARRPYGARPRKILEEMLDGRRIGADVYLVLHLGAQKITRKRTLRADDDEDGPHFRPDQTGLQSLAKGCKSLDSKREQKEPLRATSRKAPEDR